MEDLFVFSPDYAVCTLLGGSPPQPVVPAHKDKSGAPPVRSIYDDISSPGLGSTPLTSRRQVIHISSFMAMHTHFMFSCGYTVRVSNLKCFPEVCFSITLLHRNKHQGQLPQSLLFTLWYTVSGCLKVQYTQFCDRTNEDPGFYPDLRYLVMI